MSVPAIPPSLPAMPLSRPAEGPGPDRDGDADNKAVSTSAPAISQPKGLGTVVNTNA